MTTNYNVTCPTGFSYLARPLLIDDVKYLTDKKIVKEGTSIIRLLQEVCVSVLDYGYYASGEEFSWDTVYTGDILKALLDVRVGSFDDEVTIPFICTNPDCKEAYPLNLKISDIKIVPVSEITRNHITEGKLFKCTFDDAEGKPHTTTFGIPNFKDTIRITKALRGLPDDQTIAASLALRLGDISDVHANDKRNFISKLEMKTMMGLRDLMDSVDFGVQSDYKTVCSECDKVQTVDLPLDSQGFLFPTKGKSSVQLVS